MNRTLSPSADSQHEYSDILYAGDEVFGERPIRYVYSNDVGYPDAVNKALKAVEGKALWNETKVLRLNESIATDVYGVVNAYTESLIPDQLLAELGLKNFDKAQTEFNEQNGLKGGSLNGPHTQPAYLPDPRNLQGDNTMSSIHAIMIRELEATRTYVAKLELGVTPLIDGKSPSLYKGAVLVHNEHPEVVLAYADWYESCRTELGMRNREDDWYVSDFARKIEEIEITDPEDRKHIAGELSETLNFYSICGRTRGAASILFSRLIPEWKKKGYKSSILWRNGQLKLGGAIAKCSKGGDWKLVRGHQPSQGNNQSSRRFFETMGYRDIGSEVSDSIARRNITVPTEEGGEVDTDMFIQPVCLYMQGDLDVAEDECQKLNGSRYKSYDK